MSNINTYTVEVNVNFCFYVDVEAADIDSANEIAFDKVYMKAEEMAEDGCDEGMTFGFAEPEVSDCDETEEEHEGED